MAEQTARRGWRLQLDPRLVDALVAAALLAVVVVGLAGPPHPGTSPSTPAAYLLAVLFSVPFAFHRRWPMPALAVTSVAVVVYASGHFSSYPGYAVFALVFGISLHGGRRDAVVAWAASLTTLSLALVLQPPTVVTASTWVSTMLSVTVAWLAGENLKGRRARWAALEDRARRLEVEREERARQAVAEERMRIARELHDVVAHSMSVVAVQAGTAHHLIDSRPGIAKDALAAIEETSRAALVEMRRMLGVLRHPDEPGAALAPAPGLADLTTLVGQLREAGLSVLLHRDGSLEPVPPGVDLSAYRIVQECLTNVLRHGGPSAEVRVGRTTDAVTLDVRDPGRSGRPAQARPDGSGGSGHGLIGMRERVAVFGGRFTSGPEPDGGFRVTATLPFTDPAAVAPRSLPLQEPA